MKSPERLIALLLVALLSAFQTLAQPQDYRHRSITMEDGLRSNTVRHVVQDDSGFIWFGTDNGLSRYDGTEIRHFRIAQTDYDQYITALLPVEGGLLVGTAHGPFRFGCRAEKFETFANGITAHVTTFAQDKDGNVWIATMGQGAVRCNAATGEQKTFPLKSANGNVTDVLVDAENQVWAYTNKMHPVLYRLDKAEDSFQPVKLKSAVGDCGGLKLLHTSDGQLLLGTWNSGLMRLTADMRLEQLLDPKVTGVGTHIHTLFERSADCLLIGCDEGVVCLNPRTGEWRMFSEDMGSSRSSNDRFVYSITGDHEGGIWLGTFYGGVKYFSPVSDRFASYMEGHGSEMGHIVGRFCEDDFGHVWVASDDGGLACFSLGENRMVDYKGSGTLSTCNVHALCADGGTLWVGTYTNGIIRLDIATGAQRVYAGDDSTSGGSCYALYKDSRGRLWAATMEGILLYEKESDSFVVVRESSVLAVDIDEDSHGNIWFCTWGEGLCRCDAAAGEWKSYRSGANGLPSDQVNCMYVDSDGNQWVATMDGLCSFDPQTDTFSPISLEPIGGGGEVNCVIEDQGVLWVSTTGGLVRYVPGNGCQLFNRYDGLVSNQFQSNAGLKASDGRIFFGGTNGFNAFYPYKIVTNKVKPRVYITGLYQYNRRKETEEALETAGAITVAYGEKMFSLSFAALSYVSPQKNQYAYMLEGFDKGWNYVGNQHTAAYTNIPSGTYTFRVKAANNDGVWGQEARLKIVIPPPFWWSTPAKIFYVLLTLFLIWLVMHYQLRKAERRHHEEIKALKDKKEKEMREAALNFFTMIAHEIRTPLTLIIGPLEQLMGKTKSGELDVINRNAHRLLDLMNQLLDFEKVEHHGIQAHFSLQNIRRLMEEVAVRFRPMLEHKGISFEVNCPPDDFVAMVDAEGVTKIISNLMTNAGKYARDRIVLTAGVDDDGSHFTIEVADNGIGISKADQKKIFRPFYQAKDNKPGAGIGLSIVRNLVDLHHGEVSVVSAEGEGTSFTVRLPSKQENGVVEETPAPCGNTTDPNGAACPGDAGQAEESASAEDEYRPAVLIVEDDEDMSNFIAASFRADYTVYTAATGREALAVLERHAVTLIVSDWMMPEMDGAELCRRIRANRDTSHIPFILLTAKTDDDSKTLGMECGADAYIEKPFSMRYLEACIRKMIEMRQLLMKKFSSSPSEPITRIAKSPADNDFLTAMNRLIEDNIQNGDLSVNFIAEQMNISRSSLFAKIKSLSDVTPNEMIRVVRLRKAASLLAGKQFRSNEVCYMVGFNSPSYFSKCFQKQFNMTPAEYAESQ